MGMVSIIFVAALCMSAAVHGHRSTKPGRFVNKHLSYTGPDLDDGVCETEFTIQGHKFNLTDLQVDVGGYISKNNVDQFAYCVNLCKAVTSDRNCICYPCGGTQYPSQQVSMDSNHTCEAYLGQLSHTSWDLIDSSNPSTGVLLTYLDGQKGTSSQFHLYCDPKAEQYSEPEFVGHVDSVYKFVWNSTAACPHK